MLPGMDPRQIKKAMQRMGIQQKEIDATEVIIKCSDKEIVIKNPQVSKINMMGQETFQINGNVIERQLKQGISEEDIHTVINQTNCTKEEAKRALEDSNGDLAEAILSLKQ